VGQRRKDGEPHERTTNLLLKEEEKGGEKEVAKQTVAGTRRKNASLEMEKKD